MPCSRRSAIRRLLNLYIERLSTDSDYALRASISDVISEENVQTVSVLNLYSDSIIRRSRSRTTTVTCGC